MTIKCLKTIELLCKSVIWLAGTGFKISEQCIKRRKDFKLKIDSECQSWGPGHISRNLSKLCKGNRFWLVNCIHNLTLLAIT